MLLVRRSVYKAALTNLELLRRPKDVQDNYYYFIDQPLGVSTPENERKPFVCEGEYTKYGSEFRVVSLWAVEDNTDMRNIPELNEPLRMPNGDDNMAEVLRNEEKVKHRRRKKKETGEMRQQTLEETGGVAVNVDMDEEDLLRA